MISWMDVIQENSKHAFAILSFSYVKMILLECEPFNVWLRTEKPSLESSETH